MSTTLLQLRYLLQFTPSANKLLGSFPGKLNSPSLALSPVQLFLPSPVPWLGDTENRDEIRPESWPLRAFHWVENQDLYVLLLELKFKAMCLAHVEN